MSESAKEYDALAFCGGGGKGAYQMGVWKALEESGQARSIRAVSGTSIGALNAVLFALGDFARAERLWASVRPEDALTPRNGVPPGEALIRDVRETFFSGRTREQIRRGMGDIIGDFRAVLGELSVRGLFSRDGLERVLRQIDLAALSRSPMEVFVTIRNDETGLPEYRRLNGLSVRQQRRILRATTALPIVYPREQIDGAAFRDGGWNPDGNNPGGNVPIMPLYGAGCRNILISTLSSPERPDRLSYWQELEELQKRLGGGARLRTLAPASDLGGFWGTLNFEPEFLQDLMRRGYEETKAALGGGYGLV